MKDYNLQAFIITAIFYALCAVAVAALPHFATHKREQIQSVGTIALSHIASIASNAGDNDKDSAKDSPKDSAKETTKDSTKIAQNVDLKREKMREIPQDSATIFTDSATNANHNTSAESSEISENLTQDSSDLGNPNGAENAGNAGGAGSVENLSGGVNDAYALLVRNLILKAYKYPARIKNRGIKGDVIVRFVIDINGALTAQIAQSSGFDALDNLALYTLKIAARHFPSPPHLRHFQVTLGYGGNYRVK